MSKNLKYLPIEIGDLKNLRGTDFYGTSIVMPPNRVLKYWMKNLSPEVVKYILRNTSPDTNSQLRKF